MSDEDTQTLTQTSEPAPTAETPNVMGELMEQMKVQQAQFVQLQQQFEQEKQARAAAEEKADKLDKTHKRKREEVIDGTIKQFVGNLMKKYKAELTPHADELAAMFNGMKESSQSEPMLALLSCAASVTAENTASLEKAYQDNKRFQADTAALQTKLKEMKTPALSKPTERFSEPVKKPASQWKPVLPTGMVPIAQQKDGMQIRNPNFWNQIKRGGSVPSGMGWFAESRLVGKNYTEGRKPQALPTSSA